MDIKEIFKKKKKVTPVYVFHHQKDKKKSNVSSDRGRFLFHHEEREKEKERSKYVLVATFKTTKLHPVNYVIVIVSQINVNGGVDWLFEEK